MTKDVCDEILDAGVDCLTSGNNIWDKKEILGVVDLIPQLLRPLNYPASQPGRGSHVGKARRGGAPVATLNLSGRVFMHGAMDDPFTLGLAEVERLQKEAKVILVDMHGEAETIADFSLDAVNVDEAMTTTPFIITGDTALDEVVDIMAEHKYGSAIVVGREGVEGIFTATDACRALADVLRREA